MNLTSLVVSFGLGLFFVFLPFIGGGGHARLLKKYSHLGNRAILSWANIPKHSQYLLKLLSANPFLPPPIWMGVSFSMSTKRAARRWGASRRAINSWGIESSKEAAGGMAPPQPPPTTTTAQHFCPFQSCEDNHTTVFLSQAGTKRVVLSRYRTCSIWMSVSQGAALWVGRARYYLQISSVCCFPKSPMDKAWI